MEQQSVVASAPSKSAIERTCEMGTNLTPERQKIYLEEMARAETKDILAAGKIELAAKKEHGIPKVMTCWISPPKPGQLPTQ